MIQRRRVNDNLGPSNNNEDHCYYIGVEQSQLYIKITTSFGQNSEGGHSAVRGSSDIKFNQCGLRFWKNDFVHQTSSRSSTKTTYRT